MAQLEVTELVPVKERVALFKGIKCLKNTPCTNLYFIPLEAHIFGSGIKENCLREGLSHSCVWGVYGVRNYERTMGVGIAMPLQLKSWKV